MSLKTSAGFIRGADAGFYIEEEFLVVFGKMSNPLSLLRDRWSKASSDPIFHVGLKNDHLVPYPGKGQCLQMPLKTPD